MTASMPSAWWVGFIIAALFVLAVYGNELRLAWPGMKARRHARKRKDYIT